MRGFRGGPGKVWAAAGTCSPDAVRRGSEDTELLGGTFATSMRLRKNIKEGRDQSSAMGVEELVVHLPGP